MILLTNSRYRKPHIFSLSLRPICRGVNPGGWWVVTPRFWAGGSWGSWTGCEILLHLIMYRKYVRQWLLLKRNTCRIICPGVAVNVQFLPGKSNFFMKLPGGR